MNYLSLYNFIIAIAMFIPFIYELSTRFRLYFKFFVYYSVVMLSALICIPFILWRPGYVRNTLIATFPIRIVNPLLGLNWELRGVENVLPEQAAIIVANHQSSVDFLGMIYMWPILDKVTAIAKKELFYAMPFGFTAWLCGTRFINRSNPQKAKDSMNDALNFVKENKVKMWIFPEGTRNMKNEMLPFKKGAFYLALTGKLPILPIVFSSYNGFLSHPLGVFNPGNIIVTCLPAIPTDDLELEDMPELIDKVYLQMSQTFQSSSREVIQPFPAPTASKKET